MLTREPFPLGHFPIREVVINGMEIDHIPEAGVLLPDLPPHSYSVSYKVGYEGDQVPVIVGSLILNLAAYELSGEEDFKQAAIAEAVTVKQQRQRIKERNNAEAY